ncbi:unnamed protein product [Kuraishia capsulata CBS 1993]|uniref:TauD/TfdA-like domain-containing protein n=1 Tax=Kuraishia capsulata CBS 1993 TaxID=1382522 RepID=W6ML44_9ASCO|nr:uncharacterized protein KUCA_T00003176001 [Kuraishia capsulata CBS 1993]CDK27199.1 unnamed protein product [Kuraishia capsulata CBS 1993]
MTVAVQSRNVDIQPTEKKEAKTDGYSRVTEKDRSLAEHPEFLPVWDPRDKFPKLQPFKHRDRGLFADPQYKNLLAEATGPIKQFNVTPKLGTEVRSGIQLSQLSPAAKDDLALLVAQRGVVIFRDQDFQDKGPEFAKQWGSYYGPLHVHPVSGAPPGHPEVHVVWRGSEPTDFEIPFKRKVSNIAWHTDVSYELQPPGLTVLAMLQGPENGGGDTLFADTVEAYDRLSPLMQSLIENLKVAHTSTDQAKFAVGKGGIERRTPVDSIHPLVRWHPVLKKKILYFQKAFGRNILGLKEEESENLLSFLFDHIKNALDLQIRARWEPGTVVVWDNRRVVHSATLDWDSPEVRHAFRITPQAERPVHSQEEYDNWTVEKELEELKSLEATLAADPGDLYAALQKGLDGLKI